jgi:Uma2 family endonuclease
MIMAIPFSSQPPSERPRYLEQRAPIVFPESEQVPETQLHFDLRTLLYQLLQDVLGEGATVGSDQFVYYDAEDPSVCLAPDVYAAQTPAREKVRSWKVWERGAPEVAVEIVSDSDAPDLPWAVKLSRYRRLGVRELVRFDPLHSGSLHGGPSHGGPSLRIWDRVDGALVEREVQGESAASLVLNVHWVIAPAEGLPLALRVATAGVLAPTRQEARKAAEQARLESEQARVLAEARVRELEALLGKVESGTA